MKLKKSAAVSINPQEPFENELIPQQDSIELLTGLLQSTEQPFVITVEAPWGWGKTTFVKKWKAHLEKQKHVCLYFSAWESDFVADPLVAFLGELVPVVDEIKKRGADAPKLTAAFSKLKRLGSALVRKAVPIVVKGFAEKALGSGAMKELSESVAEHAKEVAELASEAAKNKIDDYQKEKLTIRGFHDALSEVAETLTEDGQRSRQLVFFVDELDRCRPDFAMTLLERIKHLFDVRNVIFVLALDRSQLRNTVNALYGTADRSDVYLRRFIDLSYELPKPSPGLFLEGLYSQFAMAEFFQLRADGGSEGHQLKAFFPVVAKWLNLDLRTQEQCFTRLNVIARLWQPTFLPMKSLCILVGLRVGHPEIFELARTNPCIPEGQLPATGPEDGEFLLEVKTTLFAVFADAKILNQEIGNPMPNFDPYLLRHLSRHCNELRRLIDLSAHIHQR